MNKENLIKLAEVLESEQAEKHFDMSSWFNDPAHVDGVPTDETYVHSINNCETTACIAGWAAVLAQPDVIPGQEDVHFGGNEFAMDAHPKEIAEAWLELDYEQARQLFQPAAFTWVSRDKMLVPYGATAKQAAKVVRHLAETGEVDWRIIDES